MGSVKKLLLRQRIRLIEELSLNGWPSLQTHLYDGWVLRVSNGYTKRSNSVNPLYPYAIELNQKIAYCKAFYENIGLPIIYKLTSDSNFLEIDEQLEKLGYIKMDETSVRLLDLKLIAPNISPRSDVSYELTDAWLNGFLKSCSIDDQIKKETIEALLKKIMGKTVFVTHKENGESVGFGYGVIDHGYVGIFDIQVDDQMRGKGYGRSVMNTILFEAKILGASKAYLQVVVGNTVAENLYRSLGFEEIYRYWYRTLVD